MTKVKERNWKCLLFSNRAWRSTVQYVQM